MFDLTAIFVNHRTAEFCVDAVASLRRVAAEEGVRPFVVVVDCDSGPDDAGRLPAVQADRLVLLRENRGYSGGLNAGIAAGESKLLLLCNADIAFLPGSLGPLIEAAGRDTVGAASPVQFADRAARIFLPTGFAPGFGRDLLQFRGASPGLWERRRFASAAIRQWELWQRGGDADHLTGSIVMTRKDVLDRVGRFDERFSFEYEETEWEDRLRAAGLALRVVAESRACHFPGSSSSRNPDSERRRRESRNLYRRRRWGALGGGILGWAEKRARSISPPAWDASRPLDAGSGAAVAVSLNPSVRPFASAALDGGVDLPDLFGAIGPSLYLRVFETATGEAGRIFHAVRT
jgi:N-acetylglucosaminyl-diphospho-decaprenol L-rhamnosyltransferase